MENAYKPPESTVRDIEVVSLGNGTLYKISGIGVATFLGGLFAGGLLLSKNFKVLGDRERARTVLIFSGLGMVAIIGLGFVIPDTWNVPNVAFQIPQIFAVYQYAKQHQAANIAAHAENGGQLASNWKAAGIALLVVFGLLAVAVPFFFLLSALQIIE